MDFAFKGWCTEPDKIIEECKKQFPNEMALTLSIADEALNNSFVFRDKWEMERTNEPIIFSDEINWDAFATNDSEWLFAFSRHTFLLNLAKAYAATKNKKYYNKFALLISDWIAKAPLTKQREQTCWRSIEAGLRAENWLKAIEIFSIYGVLEKDLKKTIDDCLICHAEYLTSASKNFQKLSNWGILQDHGLFLLGMYFGRKDYKELALSRLDEQSAIQIFDDGSHWEQSPMYHCEVLHCLLDTIFIAKINDVELNEDFLKRVCKMSHALALWCKPGGALVCQSDSDEIDARDLLAQAAIIFNDGELKFWANSLYAYENYFNMGFIGLNKYNAIQIKRPESISYALNDSGNYFLRDSLEDNSHWLHFHCGCLGSGHGHADQLHIDIAANGEDILIDTGRFTYVDGEIRRTLKSSESHNTTIIDRKSFSICTDSWGYSKIATAIKGEAKFTQLADYVSGAHMGYIDDGVLVKRQIIYIKPDIYIIIDSFQGVAKHEAEMFFHFNAQGKASLEGNEAIYKGKKAQAKLIFLGKEKLSIRRAKCSREYNLLESCDRIAAQKSFEGFGTMITAIGVNHLESLDEFSACIMPVSLLDQGKVLEEKYAQAIIVKKGNEEYTAIICHNEVISKVDLLSANDYSGYGHVIIFGKNMPQKGLTLSW